MPELRPSVADALAKAHAALRDDLQKLEKAVGPGSGTKLTELRARLAATQTHLTEHFRFEEQNGYLDVVRKREPRLDRAIEHLATEHRELLHDLGRLVCGTWAASHLEEPLREGIRTWVRRVHEHETREDELVQDAFNYDIGPED